MADPKTATIAAYDAHAAAYREGTAHLSEAMASVIARFVAEVGPGGRVLEIGSGPGRDARALEAAGLRVHRTDVTPAFVELMRADGLAAEVLDPLTDDVSDPEDPQRPWDGVFASACLLHVARGDLPTVVRRLVEATRAGGVLHVALKEGDGEAWSTHGNVAAPRHFTYWREDPLSAVLEEAGWSVVEVCHTDGMRGETWLDAWARRR